MFLEKRVYQGSSGRVYPNPFTDRISDERGAARLAGRAPRERVPARHGPARDSAGASTSVRTATRATTSSTARTSSSRRWWVCWGPGSPAASSSTGRSTTARRRSCPSTGASRTTPTAAPDRLVLGARADGPHEGHARRAPAPRPLGPGAAGAAVQPHAARADVPVVGQRRRPRPRRLPVVLPARCARYVADHAKRRHVRPSRSPAAATTASTTARAGGRRGPPLVPQHPGADLLHGHGTRRATSSAATTTPPATGFVHCRRPPHLARQEAVDLGQPRLRSGLGPQADRRRRPLHRADGRRLHRQPARLLASCCPARAHLQPVLVPHPGHRAGA